MALLLLSRIIDIEWKYIYRKKYFVETRYLNIIFLFSYLRISNLLGHDIGYFCQKLFFVIHYLVSENRTRKSLDFRQILDLDV